MPERQPGRLSSVGPWFLPLLAATLLTQSTLAAARPLVSYRVIALGGDAMAVGLVTAAFAVLPLAVAMPLGRLSDRRRDLRTQLIVGTLLFAAGPVFLSLGSSVGALALASAVLGLGQLVLLVAAQGTIARWSGPEHLDRGFGWFTAAVSGGQLLGPLLVGFLLSDASGSALAAASRHAFWVAAVLSLLALPFVVVAGRRTPRLPPRAQGDHGDRTAGRALVLLQRPGVPTGLFASLALLGAVDILTAYLPLVAERRGIAPATVGVLLALRAAATICSRLMIDALLRRWRHGPLVVASAGGTAVIFALVPVPALSVQVIGAALVVGGFLLGIGQPLTMAMLVRAVPPEHRSSGLALRLVANRFGQVSLPLLAGLVAGSGGEGALWLSCVVLGAAAVTSHRATRGG